MRPAVTWVNTLLTAWAARFAARTEVESMRLSLGRIIRTEAFTPNFQPIVNVMNDQIVGYEALTRFADGTPPEHQFAAAHQVGMGLDLELAVLRRSLAAAADLPAEAWLNLNASPQLILESGELPRLLADAGRELVVEVTEHDAIADYERFRMAVQRLGTHVRLAVDDAGAGFASLRHIIELHPDFVKLDRALVAGLATDDARKALVAGMRYFARGLGMRLIAEGVETVDELAALRELDVHLAQGYLLGRPCTAGVRRTRVPAEEPATNRRMTGSQRLPRQDRRARAELAVVDGKRGMR